MGVKLRFTSATLPQAFPQHNDEEQDEKPKPHALTAS
jgi:hypothetical protein